MAKSVYIGLSIAVNHQPNTLSCYRSNTLTNATSAKMMTCACFQSY